MTIVLTIVLTIVVYLVLSAVTVVAAWRAPLLPDDEVNTFEEKETEAA